MHIGAVERQAAGLVDIQPAMDHPADQPARLADAEDQRAARGRLAFERMVAEPGQQIADPGHAGTGHLGRLGLVGDFIELSGPEGVLEADAAGAARLFGADERPILARDRLAGIVGAGAVGQHGIRVIDDAGLVGQAIDAGVSRNLGGRRDGEFIGDLARDRAAIGHPRHRRGEDQRLDASGLGRDVPGPGREKQREAVPHQEAVTGIGAGGGVVIGRRLAVDLAENGDAAAIIDVVEQRRGIRLDRAQQDELAVEHHFPSRIARGEFQIRNGLVGRQIGIEGVMGNAADLLIRAHLTEGFTLGKRNAFDDIDPFHRGQSRGGGKESGGECRRGFTRRARQEPRRPCPTWTPSWRRAA